MIPKTAAFALLLIVISAARAVELYIDGGLGSDDSQCGLTVSAPCKTLNFTDTRATEVAGAPHTLRLLAGTYYFLNDTELRNSGSWNRLVGDNANPRLVVIDGMDTSEKWVDWAYSDNNQSGPFAFEGITVTGFTDTVIELHGQHVEVRNSIFDFRGGEADTAVEASCSWRDGPVWQENEHSNTSSVFVDNVQVYSGGRSFGGLVYCNRCHNTTVLNSYFFNTTDGRGGTRGCPAVRVRGLYVHLEDLLIEDSNGCEDGGLKIEEVVGGLIKNVELRRAGYPNPELCSETGAGHIALKEVSNLEIDGLVVTNCTAARGPALTIEDESLSVTIRNSRFESNVATYAGGALFIDTSGTSDDAMRVKVVDSVFANNSAQSYGGAVEMEGGRQEASIEFENCEFIKNVVMDKHGGSGGAVSVRNEQWNVVFTGGSITENTAEFGGAFYLGPAETTTLTVDGTTMYGNHAGLGGAILMGGHEVTFKDSVFILNSARDKGGAIIVPQGVGPSATLTVNGSTFMNQSSEIGGAIYANGGIMHITDSKIIGSTAGLGGGLFMGRNSRGTLTDTVFSNNNVGGEGICVGLFGYGAAVYFEGSSCESMHLDAVVFDDNLANVSGGAYFMQDPSTCGDIDDWCTDCVFEQNQALGSGADGGAPFDAFKPAHPRGRLPVTLGEKFFLDAIPYDAYGQPMSGNHELVNAKLVDSSSAVFLCGDHETTASRGLARFAFTAYVIDTDGRSRRAIQRLSSGRDLTQPLFLEPRSGSDSDGPVEFIDLAVSGCPSGYELDLLSEHELRDLMEQCNAHADTLDAMVEGDELPPLMQCTRQTNLTDAQRVVVLVLAGLTMLVGTALVFAACLMRNNRVVWSSSPFMMLVATAGFYALEVAAFLRAMRPTSSAMCMGYVGLFVLGINLLLGSAIAKNLRVWKIFTLKSLQVVNIPNWKLLLGILVASIPDIITLSIQSAVFPLTVDTSVQNSECRSGSAGTFLALYAMLKILWLGAGVGTCWLVRKVPDKFNEAKSTTSIVTCVALALAVIWAIGAIVFAQDRTMIEVFVTALLAVVLITINLAPKLLLIYRKRDGTLMSTSGASQTQTMFTDFDQSKTEKSKGAAGSSEEGAPVFQFKARFGRLKEDLRRTQKLYERSYENTQELQDRFRAIESDLIALQFERDYRADVGGEEMSTLRSTTEDEKPEKAKKKSSRRASGERVKKQAFVAVPTTPIREESSSV